MKKEKELNNINEAFSEEFKNKLLNGKLQMRHWRSFYKKLKYLDFSSPEVCIFVEKVENRFLDQLSQTEINRSLELQNARKRARGE